MMTCLLVDKDDKGEVMSREDVPSLRVTHGKEVQAFVT